MPRSRRKQASPLRARRVFLNIPYSPSYERLFVALIAALVTVNAEPVLAFDIAEVGEGRLRRIRQAIERCRLSIHDLSYGHGRTPRFNMPFELGMACTVRQRGHTHEFRILEAREHRLQRTLSDLNGFDPLIHGRQPKRMIRAALLIANRGAGGPSADDIHRLYPELWRRYVPLLRQRHGEDLYSRDVFDELCVIIRHLAGQRGLL